LKLKSRVIAEIPRLEKKGLASGLPQDYPGLSHLKLKSRVIAEIPRLEKKGLASG
jgi:hypothetical protein